MVEIRDGANATTAEATRPARVHQRPACRGCGAEFAGQSARFCYKCGASITMTGERAEYKQVTVLFADVVGSMDLASVLDAERLREIMTEVFNRSAVVVQRYGGTVDKFTGDGIMALFGAPIALEDHALRGCLAALGIQEEVRRLAADVQRRDHVTLRIRVGLNSGRVIAGDIGARAISYTAIGEQVGMAQRMESVALPGGVTLSESTARLVGHAAVLGEAESVDIKGADAPVPIRRLLGMKPDRAAASSRHEWSLVGRRRELNVLAEMLHQSIGGAGHLVGVVGPAGIGKSRIVRESATLAKRLGVKVFSTCCESHASGVPFHVVAQMLRAVFGLADLDAEAARARVRARIPGADPEDLLLLDDLIGIGDPHAELADIDPDARRRRLARLVNAASLARETPAMFVVEDAHWIDEASETMFTEFLSVIARTRSLMLITYRPEYRGALSRIADSVTLALGPLSPSQGMVLTAEMLGRHPSVTRLVAQVADKAAGNPFFTEEIVRDLAERGVLAGAPGAYVCQGDVSAVSVPATVSATIAARIDRLGGAAKETLNAAAVIGSPFDARTLTTLLDGPQDGLELVELVEAELIDQVTPSPRPQYAFRHPLIRTVAYESQLKSERADLHRRLAAAIEHQDRGALDENAALIGTHLEAAGDLQRAFAWHMKAGMRSTYRDIGAARVSWQRARQVADRLPADAPERVSMRIAPRTLLCGTSWQVGGSVADTGFDELRELATVAQDGRSLAVGMAGLLTSLNFHARYRESSQLASECASLIESLGDPAIAVRLLYGPMYAKLQAGAVLEALRLAQRVIDLADADPRNGGPIVGSPLALAIAGRAAAKCFLGIAGWKKDFDDAIARARALDATTCVIAIWFKYGTITHGAVAPDAAALRDTAEALRMAERSADDFTLALARLTRGLVLIHRQGPEHGLGFELLAGARQTAVQERFTWTALPIIDSELAKEKARVGDLDAAIKMARAVIESQFDTGEMIWRGPSATVLVESLLRRGHDGDRREAQAVIDRLATVPTDPGFVLHDIPLLRLRAMLAQDCGDAEGFRDYFRRYRAKLASSGFEH
ncbi:MAG: AAA family ATPase [Mycobacteriaceae bacterium]|nr:AAA family ATPase [Mycobacteriaceae bacterium]